MPRVSDPTLPPPPGERRLDRPPSDRYREPATGPSTSADTEVAPGSIGRAVGVGILVGLAGAVVTVILGGALGVSAGLLVVAGATGWAIGLATKVGGGSSVAPTNRRWIAVGIAVAVVVLGQIGLWLYAGTEGGVLSLPDYLGETFGPLVPLQVVIAAVAAWWAAR
jgi:hypothetical protein